MLENGPIAAIPARIACWHLNGPLAFPEKYAIAPGTSAEARGRFSSRFYTRPPHVRRPIIGRSPEIGPIFAESG
ncbi:MAG TPA: hypothetical protein VGX78_13735, partial [Pirellulales bacterium]|nr:hypothetical protein [Pirellulales bacterium]